MKQGVRARMRAVPRPAHLVVHHEVHGAAGGVLGEVAQLQRLRHHALPAEGGVAVDEEAHGARPRPVVGELLLRAHGAHHHGGHGLQVAGVGRQVDAQGPRPGRVRPHPRAVAGEGAVVVRQASRAPLEGLVHAEQHGGAQVVLDVPRLQVAAPGLELGEEGAQRLVQRVGQHVEAPAVRHAQVHALHTGVAAVEEEAVHAGDQGLDALDAEALGRGEPLAHDVLKQLRLWCQEGEGGRRGCGKAAGAAPAHLHQLLQHVETGRVGKVCALLGPRLHLVDQPPLLGVVGDVAQLHTEGARVALPEEADQLVQRPFPAVRCGAVQDPERERLVLPQVLEAEGGEVQARVIAQQLRQPPCVRTRARIQAQRVQVSHKVAPPAKRPNLRRPQTESARVALCGPRIHAAPPPPGRPRRVGDPTRLLGRNGRRGRGAGPESTHHVVQGHGGGHVISGLSHTRRPRRSDQGPGRRRILLE